MLALKALSLLLLHKYENQETSTKKGRKHWVWPWPGNRQLFGCYSLLQETKRDTKAFRDFIRMEESQFEYLVEALTPIILKEDRNMTECIIPHEMVLLSITLARGETFWSLESQFRIGKKTIFCIDVCQAIFEILELRYVNMPRNTRKWFEISDKFYRRWEFLNGVGATDGKHIVMEQLFNSCS